MPWHVSPDLHGRIRYGCLMQTCHGMSLQTVEVEDETFVRESDGRELFARLGKER